MEHYNNISNRHNLSVRTYPHTNCVFSLGYIAIGVGVNSQTPYGLQLTSLINVS